MPRTFLTKSKYISGLQCSKLLWTEIHAPEIIPEPDIVTRYLFDQGHTVGELAKKIFSGGIDISPNDFMENINKTKEFLKQRKPLYEAGILTGKIYIRVDILNPINEDEWEIIEVKSSTSVKDVHVNDVSFQRFCCNKAGLKIKNCKLAYVNTQYVKNGEIDPKEFFTIEDISTQVEEASADIEERLLNLLDVISREKCPEAIIGKHCLAPYDCSLHAICWEFLPDNSIFDLRGGKTKQFSLYEQGIVSIKDIPNDITLSRQQHIQKECVIIGTTHIEKENIQLFLDGLKYPLYYLDFETMGPVIPLYDSMKPYQTIPFQFSLHIVADAESVPVHHSFLADGIDDPRPQLLYELRSLLGTQGSIIAYNSGFEEGVLKELVEVFPEYTDWLSNILPRIVDLLYPFTNFHYYHASLKKVLPAITGRGYEDMSIGAGMDASIAYERVTYGSASQDEIAKIRTDLTKYCKLDTEGMIWIVKKLRDLCR